MNTQMRIAEPCHEDWNAMSPNDQGRHCNLCCKTVIDFSSWDTDDILHYLRQHKNVCGRLRKDQLEHTPEMPGLHIIPLVHASPLSYGTKMTAIIALLFVFASCGNQASVPATAAPADTATVPVAGAPIAIPPPPMVPDTTGKEHPIESIKSVSPIEYVKVVPPVEPYPMVQGGISIDEPEPIVQAPLPPPEDTLRMGPFHE